MLALLALILRRGELYEVGWVDVVLVDARDRPPAELFTKNLFELAVDACEYWVELILFSELGELFRCGCKSRWRRDEGVTPCKEPPVCVAVSFPSESNSILRSPVPKVIYPCTGGNSDSGMRIDGLQILYRSNSSHAVVLDDP